MLCVAPTSWKAPASHTREWRCFIKIFQKALLKPQNARQLKYRTRAKTKTKVLSIVLTSSQLLCSINITIRMSPVWAPPELQLDCKPGGSPLEQEHLSSFEIPYLRLRDTSLPKVKRSLNRKRFLVSDWFHAELILMKNYCSI